MPSGGGTRPRVKERLLQLTTDTACSCLLCPTVFARKPGMSNAAAMLCELCWQDMRAYYYKHGFKVKTYYPDHVLAFVTHVEAIREKADPSTPRERAAEPQDPVAAWKARPVQ